MVNPLRFVEYFVIVVALGAGGAFIFLPHYFNGDRAYNLAFGIFLVLYGLFRIWRIIKRQRSES